MNNETSFFKNLRLSFFLDRKSISFSSENNSSKAPKYLTYSSVNKRKIIELLQTIDIEEAEKFGDAAANFLQKIQATANYKKKRY